MTKTLIRAVLALALFAAGPAFADTVNHGAVTTDPATGANQTTGNTKLDTLHSDLAQLHTDHSDRTGSAPPLTVPAIFSGTFVPNTSYVGAGLGFGASGSSAIIPVLVGSANTVVKIQTISLAVSTTTAASLPGYRVFEGNPTASTYTDGVTASLAAADRPKLVGGTSPGLAMSQASGSASEPQYYTTTLAKEIMTDSGGYIYIAFVTVGAISPSSPRADWRISILK